MLIGTIVTWFVSRNYGFIVPDVAGPEVFIHITDLPPEIAAQPKGYRVQYEIAKFNGRVKAVRVSVSPESEVRS